MDTNEHKENRRMNIFIQACGLVTVLFGCSALLGWILDITELASFDSRKIPMALSTASLFIAYGLIIFFHNRLHSSRIVSWFGIAFSSVLILGTLLLLYLSLSGIRVGVEHLGINMNRSVDGLVVGHMSPITAFCFVLAGLSVLMVLTKNAQKIKIKTSLIFAALVFFISIIFLLSYIFGAPLLYEGSFIPPALTTSLAFLFLAIGLLLLSGLKVWSYEELSDALSTRYTYILSLVFIGLIIATITAGYSYYTSYKRDYRAEIGLQLSSLAELKVSLLVQWRKERLGDASLFYKNPNFSDLIKRYLHNQKDLQLNKQIQTWLDLVLTANRYNRLCVYSNEGDVIFSSPSELNNIPYNNALLLPEILKSGQIFFQDFYRDKNDNNIYLNIFVPILFNQSDNRAIGILAFRIDPWQYLYPLISKWPTPSRTAETLLIRREGNEVVYLNELRFQKNTAFNLRRPLSQINLPNAIAASGHEGIIEGTDYRGVSVIADVRAIPNSPWFLVSRMDQSEVYEPLRDRFWGIIFLIIGLLIGSGASVGLVWRHQRSKFTKERYQSTEKIRNLNRIYTVRSDINQAIVHFRNLQELFEKVCHIAIETGGFKIAWIGKANSQTKKVDVIASEGISEEYLKNINLNYDNAENLLGITGLSVKNGKHVISNDIQNDNISLLRHKNAAIIGYKSFGAFPLKVFEKVWGVIKLYSGETGFFDEEELKLLDELAMDISFAIEFAEKEIERKLSVKALMESEKQFRSVVEEAVEIVFTVDNQGYFTYVNLAGLKSSGYSLDELKHFKYIDLIEPEYKHRVKRNYFKQYLDRSTLSTTEYPFRSKSGEIKWFNQNARLIIENDEVKGFYIIARDVTERRIAETALMESEERFRSLYENSTIGLYRTTPGGKIILANPTLIKMLGYSSFEELTVRNLEKEGFDPTNDRKLFLEQIEINGEVNGSESVWNIKDGTAIYIRESARAIRDSKGKTLYYDGTVEDITERKRTEKEFVMLAHSLKSVNESVCITDLENKIIFVNESFLKTYGYNEKELDGKDISIIYPSNNRPELEEKILPATLSGGWQGELWNKRKDGSEFPIYLSTTIIHDKEGKILGLIGVAIDITERKRTEIELIEAKEKAEEMSRLKSNFLANMSHELRTPLVGIIGYADILRQEIEDPELKERVEVIFKSGTRLSQTLNLILDLSKFESEKINFRYQEIDIVNETEDIISLFKETALEKGLILKSSFSDPSIIINMDERAFHSILSNLINNALKFTTEGGITVVISLKDNFVEIKVIDSGIGIAKKDHEIIFEEFRQVSEGLIRNFEGTGLGLNITKKLVEKLGGEISVFSEPGKGSTFIVKLPVTNSKEPGEDKMVIEKTLLTELTIQKSVKPTALLVDDDPIVFPVLKKYTGGQVNLESTSDGEFAIKLCSQKQYDYIFMDINLRRGMDGVQVTQIIRKIKGYESIPIIATTAYAMAGDKEAFLAAGCSHYLSKPFNEQDIRNLMEEISSSR